jgi:transcription antitermination factor NusG
MPDCAVLPCWYAMVVKPRHEKTVAAGLRVQGFHEFLPTYTARHRWSDRSKRVELPLFAGYVFGSFDLRDRLRVTKTPGVRSIVSFANTPCPVPNTEIEAIKMAVESGLPLEPWPLVRAGQQVRVESGPLSGLEGVLLKDKGFYRVVIEVSLLNRSMAVEIERSMIGPILKCPGKSPS